MNGSDSSRTLAESPSLESEDGVSTKVVDYNFTLTGSLGSADE